MFGFGRKRRRDPDLDRELKQLRVVAKRMELEGVRSLLNSTDASARAIGIGALNKGLGKLLIGQPQTDSGDRYLTLLIETLRSQNPVAMMREVMALKRMQEDMFEPTEPQETDNILVQMLQTPAAQQVAAGLVQVATTFAAGAANAAPVQGATVREIPSPHQVPPAQSATLTAEQVIQAFEQLPPDQMAITALRWARESPQLAQALQMLLQTPTEQLPATLRAYTYVPGWGDVARWLLEHEAERDAFLAALRQVVAQAQAGAQNGHAESSGMGL